jgi:hypothetical protein
MDLALQSSSRNMTFNFNGQLPTPDLFRHELIQRAVTMGISTGQRIFKLIVVHTLILDAQQPLGARISKDRLN